MIAHHLPSHVEHLHCITTHPGLLCPALSPHALVMHPVFPATVLFLNMFSSWTFFSSTPWPQPATLLHLLKSCFSRSSPYHLLRQAFGCLPVLSPDLHYGAISLDGHHLASFLCFTCSFTESFTEKSHVSVICFPLCSYKLLEGTNNTLFSFIFALTPLVVPRGLLCM